VTLPGIPFEQRLLRKVATFAAESEPLAQSLRDSGVASEQIDVVYPGVDLERFANSSAPPTKPFRLLFASSPAEPSEIDVRGIPQAIELARVFPDVEIVLLWRRWGKIDVAQRAIRKLSPPENVRLILKDSEDMAAEYRDVHAILCLYGDGFGKSCPNSVIEALAAGRPALLTDTVGIAALVESEGAGRAVARNHQALAGALDDLRSNYTELSRNARLLAEREFDQHRHLAAYRSLYKELGAAPL